MPASKPLSRRKRINLTGDQVFSSAAGATENMTD